MSSDECLTFIHWMTSGQLMNASQIVTLATVFWSSPNIQNHSSTALAILLPADPAPGCFIRSCQVLRITNNIEITFCTILNVPCIVKE